MNGQACMRGLRMPAAMVSRCDASGMTRADVLATYLDLADADISPRLEYTAGLAVNGP